MLETDFILVERERIQAEYRRRRVAIHADRYAPWQPDVLFTRSHRQRLAAQLLHRVGCFPQSGEACLEIGFGSLGWLGDLISWGVPETDLHGIELDASRAQKAQALLPNAKLCVGDATALPWPAGQFKLVIASTLFTSVLDDRVRQLIADEITRVLAPGGGLLWYDFAMNNPRNPHVRRVNRQELRNLFPALRGHIRSTTLAAPLARLIAPRSWLLAELLENLPFMRTSLLAVLTKPITQQDAKRIRTSLPFVPTTTPS